MFDKILKITCSNFLEKYFISDSPKNTFWENTFIKNTLSRNIVKHTPSMFQKIYENIRSKNLFLTFFLLQQNTKGRKKY